MLMQITKYQEQRRKAPASKRGAKAKAIVAAQAQAPQAHNTPQAEPPKPKTGEITFQLEGDVCYDDFADMLATGKESALLSALWENRQNHGPGEYQYVPRALAKATVPGFLQNTIRLHEHISGAFVAQVAGLSWPLVKVGDACGSRWGLTLKAKGALDPEVFLELQRCVREDLTLAVNWLTTKAEDPQLALLLGETASGGGSVMAGPPILSPGEAALRLVDDMERAENGDGEGRLANETTMTIGLPDGSVSKPFTMGTLRRAANGVRGKGKGAH